MKDIATYDYLILSNFFPDSAVEQFRESAINPIIALLNAEFVEGGDKAIAELLHAIPNVDKFTNNGGLKSNLQKTYAHVIKDGGISFRGKSIECSGVTKCLSFKPVTPRLDKEGKPVKYENPPKSISQVLLPQIDIDTWKDICSRCGVEIPDDVDINRTWQTEEIGSEEWRDYHEFDLNEKFVKWLKDNPQVPIVITEGAKKTYSGTSASYVLAGLGGVWNGCEKIDKDKDTKDENNYKLITDLRMLAILGRKFVIAFDKDTKPKTIAHVKMAAKRLANLLTAEGCEVTFANWDSEDGKGIDDLIFNKGFDAFINAVENSGAELISPKPKTTSKNDSYSSASEGSKPEPPKNPPPLEMSKSVFKDLFENIIRFDASVKQYWRYNGKGMWVTCSNEYIFHTVSEYIEANVPLPFSPSYVENVIKFALGKVLHEGWTEASNLLYIPFTNGVLEMKTKQLLPHSPDYGFTWQLPRTYSVIEASWGNIDRFLDELCVDNKQLKDIAISFCTAILTGRSDLQKFLYLFGSGANGKGAFMSLLSMLVGKENTHSTTMSDLNENRFEAANLKAKRLVLMTDEDKRVGGLSVFKSATGQDPIRNERKGKDANNFIFKGMFVIAANSPTFVGDSNFAIKRRKLDFPCLARIAESERRELTPEFEANLTAFTTYLLALPDEWVTATIRGASSVEAVKQLNWEMTIREDSIAAFYDECLIIDLNGIAPCGELYKKYQSYCEDSGLKSKSIKNFTPSLVELCNDSLGHSISKKRTSSGETIRGLRFREASDEEREEETAKNSCYPKSIYPTHPTLLAQGKLLNPTLYPTQPCTTMHHDKSNTDESEPLTEF
jgi:putative DNA primase/helicase